MYLSIARTPSILVIDPPPAPTHASVIINPIDPEPYIRAPRFAVDTGLSLTKMLLRHVPKRPSAGVVMGAQLLAASVTALEKAWQAQGQPQPARSARAADTRLDRAWGAVHDRLRAWSIFPADDPDHTSSKAIAMRLFPSGLDFLTLQFLAEHAQSERRIKIIVAEGLRAALDHLVGEVFMDELLAAHEAYGDALGITKATPGDAKPTPSLDEPLRALSQSVVAYALQIVAFAALKAENVEPARQALRPIDEYRAAASRRGNGTSKDQPVDGVLPEGAPAPDSPLPELPTVADP